MFIIVLASWKKRVDVLLIILGWTQLKRRKTMQCQLHLIYYNQIKKIKKQWKEQGDRGEETYFFLEFNIYLQ